MHRVCYWAHMSLVFISTAVVSLQLSIYDHIRCLSHLYNWEVLGFAQGSIWASSLLISSPTCPCEIIHWRLDITWNMPKFAYSYLYAYFYFYVIYYLRYTGFVSILSLCTRRLLLVILIITTNVYFIYFLYIVCIICLSKMLFFKFAIRLEGQESRISPHKNKYKFS